MTLRTLTAAAALAALVSPAVAFETYSDGTWTVDLSGSRSCYVTTDNLVGDTLLWWTDTSDITILTFRVQHRPDAFVPEPGDRLGDEGMIYMPLDLLFISDDGDRVKSMPEVMVGPKEEDGTRLIAINLDTIGESGSTELFGSMLGANGFGIIDPRSEIGVQAIWIMAGMATALEQVIDCLETR